MDNKVLGYANHDTAMVCLALSNERDLYDQVRSLDPHQLTNLSNRFRNAMDLGRYAKAYGLTMSKVNWDEVLEHARSIHNAG